MVEQILSSHPDVYGGDELNSLPNLIKKYLQSNISNTLLKNPFVFKNIADSYVGELKKISNSSIKVTDKLPINFMWIGLINQFYLMQKLFIAIVIRRTIVFLYTKIFL